MEEVALNQLDEKIWIEDVAFLCIWPHNTSEVLRRYGARIVFKCHFRWLFFRHSRLLKDGRHFWIVLRIFFLPFKAISTITLTN